MTDDEFDNMVESVTDDARKRFDRFAEPFGLSGASPGVFVERGDPGKIIPELIENEGADLIVMGTVGRGRARRGHHGQHG